MLFLRTSDDGQEVVVFAAVVHDVAGRSRAAEVLNDLNVEARWVKFQLIRDRVFATVSVLAKPFVPAHLHRAVRILSDVADGIDDELAAKLRRRTTFDTARTLSRDLDGRQAPEPWTSARTIALPITAWRDEIAAAIREHQVVIVAGETGSGKTTQLPKICLELGRGVGSVTPSRGGSPPARSRSGSPRSSSTGSVSWSATRSASPARRPEPPGSR